MPDASEAEEDGGRSIGRLLIHVVSAAGVEPAAMSSKFSVQMRVGRSTGFFEDIMRGNRQLQKFQKMRDPLKSMNEVVQGLRERTRIVDASDTDVGQRSVMVVKAVHSLVADTLSTLSDTAKEVVEATVGEKQVALNGRCATPEVQCTSGVSVRWDAFIDLNVTDVMVAAVSSSLDELLHVQLIETHHGANHWLEGSARQTVVGEAYIPFLDQAKSALTDQKILLALPERDDANGAGGAAERDDSGNSGVVLHVQLQWAAVHEPDVMHATIARCKSRLAAMNGDAGTTALDGMNAMKKFTDLLNPFSASGKAQRFVDTIGHPFHFANVASRFVLDWEHRGLSAGIGIVWALLCIVPALALPALIVGLISTIVFRRRVLVQRQRRRAARALKAQAALAAAVALQNNAGRRRDAVKHEVARGVAICSVPVVKVHSRRGRYERIFEVTASGFCTIDPSAESAVVVEEGGASECSFIDEITNAWSFTDDFISVAQVGSHAADVAVATSAAAEDAAASGVLGIFASKSAAFVSEEDQKSINAAEASFRSITIEIKLRPRSLRAPSDTRSPHRSLTPQANAHSYRTLKLEVTNEFQATRIVSALRQGRAAILGAGSARVGTGGKRREYAQLAALTPVKALGPKHYREQNPSFDGHCSVLRPVAYCNVSGANVVVTRHPRHPAAGTAALDDAVRPNATVGVVELKTRMQDSVEVIFLKLRNNRGWVAARDSTTGAELLIPQSELIAREHRQHVIALRHAAPGADDVNIAGLSHDAFRVHGAERKMFDQRVKAINLDRLTHSKNKNVAKVAHNFGVNSMKGLLVKERLKKGASSRLIEMETPGDVELSDGACGAESQRTMLDDKGDSGEESDSGGELVAGAEGDLRPYVAYSNRGVEFSTRVENVELLMQILEWYADIVDRLTKVWEVSLGNTPRIFAWLCVVTLIVLPVVVALSWWVPPHVALILAGEVLLLYRCRVVTYSFATLHAVCHHGGAFALLWLVPDNVRRECHISSQRLLVALGVDELFAKPLREATVLRSVYNELGNADVSGDDADADDAPSAVPSELPGHREDLVTAASVLGNAAASRDTGEHVEVVIETQRWFGKWRADVWLPYDNDRAKPPKGWRFDGLWRASSWQFASHFSQGAGGLLSAYLSSSQAAATADKVAAIGVHAVVMGLDDDGAAAAAAPLDDRARRARRRVKDAEVWRAYVVGDTLRRRVWQRRIVPDTAECRKSARKIIIRLLRRRLQRAHDEAGDGGSRSAGAVLLVDPLLLPDPTDPTDLLQRVDPLAPSTPVRGKSSRPRLTPRLSTPMLKNRLSAMAAAKYAAGVMDEMIATCPKAVMAVYEHQRWWPGRGWTTEMLPTDGFAWSDESGKVERRKDDAGFNSRLLAELGADWQWAEVEWTIENPADDCSRAEDAEHAAGTPAYSSASWAYTSNFTPSLAHGRVWAPKRVPDKFDLVRRRKWIRTLVMVGAYSGTAGAVLAGDAGREHTENDGEAELIARARRAVRADQRRSEDRRLDAAIKTLRESRAVGLLPGGSLSMTGMYSVQLKVTAKFTSRDVVASALERSFHATTGYPQNTYIVISRAPSVHDGLFLPGCAASASLEMSTKRRGTISPRGSSTPRERASDGDVALLSGGSPGGGGASGEGKASSHRSPRTRPWLSRVLRKRKSLTAHTTPWELLSPDGLISARRAEKDAVDTAQTAASNAIEVSYDAARAAELADAAGARVLWTSAIVTSPNGGLAPVGSVLIPLQRICGNLARSVDDSGDSETERIRDFDLNQTLVLRCYCAAESRSGRVFLGQARSSLRYLLSNAPVVLTLGPSALDVYGRDSVTRSTSASLSANALANGGTLIVEQCEMSPRRIDPAKHPNRIINLIDTSLLGDSIDADAVTPGYVATLESVATHNALRSTRAAKSTAAQAARAAKKAAKREKAAQQKMIRQRRRVAAAQQQRSERFRDWTQSHAMQAALNAVSGSRRFVQNAATTSSAVAASVISITGGVPVGKRGDGFTHALDANFVAPSHTLLPDFTDGKNERVAADHRTQVLKQILAQRRAAKELSLEGEGEGVLDDDGES